MAVPLNLLYVKVSNSSLGTVDPDTEEYSGKNVTYIYPDCQMAIIGRFTNGTFISGYMHIIENISMEDNTV